MIERSWAEFPARPAEEFPSSKLTFCADSYSMSMPAQPLLPQQYVKDPSHSAKSADARLLRNTHTPLTEQSRGGQTMLSRHSVEPVSERRSTATRVEKLVHSHLSLLSRCGLISSIKSGAGAHELISILKKKKKGRLGMIRRPLPPPLPPPPLPPHTILACEVKPQETTTFYTNTINI